MYDICITYQTLVVYSKVVVSATLGLLHFRASAYQWIPTFDTGAICAAMPTGSTRPLPKCLKVELISEDERSLPAQGGIDQGNDCVRRRIGLMHLPPSRGPLAQWN